MKQRHPIPEEATGEEKDRLLKKNYLSASEVSVLLGVSKSKAYVVIRKLNEELEKKYIVFRGKIPTDYLLKRTGLDRRTRSS